MRIRRPAWLTANSLAFRFAAGAAFLLFVGLFGGAVILTSLFRDSLEKDFDVQLSVELDAVIAETEVVGKQLRWVGSRGSDGRFQTQDSGWYWQVLSGGKPVVWSQSLIYEPNWVMSVRRRLKARQSVLYYAAGPDGAQRLRFVARRIEHEDLGNKAFVYVVAAETKQVDERVADFRGLLGWSFAALGLVMLATVLLQVRYGLLPLGRVPPALAAIRSGKADRLTGSFPTEVLPLVGEINALLDHNAQVVERARTQVGNLAHALKTPLAVLTNEAHGKTGQLGKTVTQQADVMKDQVDRYLSRARAAARASVIGARTMVMPVVEDLHRTLVTIYRERTLSITAEGPEAAAFRGERQDLEEMLGNLMDNACKWAEGKVRVSVVTDAGDLTITIEDDGPGLKPTERRAARKRGTRIDETTPGSGLGLSIVHDLADLYDGQLDLEKAKLGGLAAVLLLPAVPLDER